MRRYADTVAYSKTCPDCGRVFNHPPAYASHVGSRLCREDTATLSQPASVDRSKLGAASQQERLVWNALEDAQLARLVRLHGPGGWDGKSAAFTTARSASALRRRWQKLEDAAQENGVSMGEERVPLYNTATKRKVAGGSAPRRDHLERYLQDHPEYEVFQMEEEEEQEEEEEEKPSLRVEVAAPSPRETKTAADSPATSSVWSAENDATLLRLVAEGGAQDWKEKAAAMPGEQFNASSVRKRWLKLDKLAREAGGSAAAPAQAAPSSPRDTVWRGGNKSSSLWSEAEDGELRTLVAQHGVGNWSAIASQSTTARSADAVRKRWAYVLAPDNDEDEQSASSDDPRPDSGPTWTALEDAELAALVQEHGVGNWAPMGAAFSSKRSKSSLRGRWMRLEEEAAAEGGDAMKTRIRLWDEAKKEVVQGDAAPMRSELSSFLAAHPGLEVYTGQNSASARQAYDSLGRTSWTAAEDAELTQLVQQHGVGNWAAMGENFSTSRSSDSLRHRWVKLQQYLKDGGPSASLADLPQAGQSMKATPDALGRTLWTQAEDTELSQLVVKHGAGNWEEMEANFSTSRSGDALRKRWVKLQSPGAFAEPGTSGRRTSTEVDRLGAAGASPMGVSSSGRQRKAVDFFNPATAGGGGSSPRGRPGDKRGVGSSPHPQSEGGDYSRSGRMRKTVDSYNPEKETAAEAKHKAEAANERVVLWNTVTQRKVAGNSAPRRAHLEAYLNEHPEYEVFDGQNEPGYAKKKLKITPSLTSPKGGMPAAAEDPRTVWSALEDAQLARLVHEGGASNWVHKSSVFATSRTASAIRMRWMKLEEEAEALGTTACEMRIAVWNRETERVTAGNGAPRRENLERFLAERPEYSVYQDAAPSPRPLDSPRGPKGEDEVRQFWTEAEDAQLVSLVRQYGVGEWTAKSQVFATARSANSLRKRWTKIEEEEIQKGGVPGAGPDERVKVWNRVTQRALAGMSAPRRSNLARYLQEHPECEVYNGQNEGEGGEARTRTFWTAAEDEELTRLAEQYGVGNWSVIASVFSTGRSANGLRKRWSENRKRYGHDEAEEDPDAARPGPAVVEYSRSGRLRKAVDTYNPDAQRADVRSPFHLPFTEPSPLRLHPARAESSAAQIKEEDERVVLWNTATQRKVAGNSAPRRAHLQAYLNEHPEYEVFDGQNEPGRRVPRQLTESSVRRAL